MAVIVKDAVKQYGKGESRRCAGSAWQHSFLQGSLQFLF